ncbi:MAG: ATP-binding protein [Solirubrobacterales bacterium]
MITISLVSFFAFLVYLYFGLYVLRIDPQARLNRIFCALCLAAALWAFCGIPLFTAPSAERAMFWLRAGMPGWCLVPGLMLHFSLVFVHRDRFLNTWWGYPLLYGPGLLFIIRGWTGVITSDHFIRFSYGWYGVPASQSIWYWLFSLYYLSFVLAVAYLIWRWGQESNYVRERKQAWIIMSLVLLTVFLNFLNETLLPALGISYFPKVPHVFGLIWIAGCWYAIVKLRMLTLTPAMATDGLLTRITDMTFLVDSSGMILKTNARVSEILGYLEDELVHQPLNYYVPGGFTDAQQLLRDGRPGVQVETHLKARRGEWIPARLSYSLIQDRHGDALGFSLIAQDLRQTRRLEQEVMERKRAEEALKKSNEALLETNRAMTDLLSTVSHELRTPLTSILGFARIVSNRLERVILPLVQIPDERTAKTVSQVTENLEIVILEGERLAALINDLLDIAKLEAGKIDWRMEPVKLDDIIYQSVESMRPLCDQKGVMILTELPEKMPTTVGDRDRLIQVMINLLSNALKASDTSDHILCKAIVHQDLIRVSVQDSGPGIAPEDLERIFEKYAQSSPGNARGKGTGLGLAICRQIVESHSGRIWAENASGRGAIFQFTLPISK